MKILAIELSSDQRSVAFLDTDTNRTTTAAETGTRHTLVFGLIEQVLKEALCPQQAVERLAIGIGPGSYMGIRMAISLAQGWHLARGTSLVAIGSMDCLAARAQSQLLRGEVDFVADAQRGEFYLAAYQLSATGWLATEPLQLVSRTVIEERLKAGRRILGPDAARHFSGAEAFHPDATHLARLAAGASATILPEKLEPIYLRPISFVKAPPPRIIPD